MERCHGCGGLILMHEASVYLTDPFGKCDIGQTWHSTCHQKREDLAAARRALADFEKNRRHDARAVEARVGHTVKENHVAIRVRKDGTMWCAAHTQPMDGDTYIDDGQHYYLSVECGLIVALPMPDHVQHPQWWWLGSAPQEADRWAANRT